MAHRQFFVVVVVVVFLSIFFGLSMVFYFKYSWRNDMKQDKRDRGSNSLCIWDARHRQLYLLPIDINKNDYYIFCWCWKNAVNVPLRRAIFSSNFCIYVRNCYTIKKHLVMWLVINVYRTPSKMCPVWVLGFLRLTDGLIKSTNQLIRIVYEYCYCFPML